MSQVTCCPPAFAPGCSVCASVVPQRWKVTFNTIANDDCGGCTNLNDTYLLARTPDFYCRWCQILTGTCGAYGLVFYYSNSPVNGWGLSFRGDDEDYGYCGGSQVHARLVRYVLEGDVTRHNNGQPPGNINCFGSNTFERYDVVGTQCTGWPTTIKISPG